MRKILLLLFLFAGIIFGLTIFAEDETKVPATGKNMIIVYYLHNTFRCVSCNTIEGLTKVAVLGGEYKNEKNGQIVNVKPQYKELIEKKQLVFIPVNVDKKENKHFLKDFKADAKYPVLTELSDGMIIKYKVLEDVWDLMDENEKFVKYIHLNLNEYIKSMQNKK